MSFRRNDDGSMTVDCRRPDTAESRCFRCRQRILWTTSPRGRAMPLDFIPTDDGDWTIQASEKPGKSPNAVRWDAEQHGDAVLRYSCHLATCPRGTA